MSFDLYSDESDARLNSLAPVTKAEPGIFDNFAVGTAKYTMQGFAKTGRAIDMLGAVGPIAQDKIMGTGTEAQDRYFKEHDEVFGRAVDYWTPKPGEVGAAGEVVGQLLGVLPQVFASPGLAVASTQLSVGEELINKGVDATKAQTVGAVQAAGLGLGIWMPILGRTLTQRVLAGGVGFNVVQGAGTRGASGAILEGTPAEGDFKAFDATGITLDVLLGAAFGGLAHIHPGMRAEGEAMQKRFADWAGNLKPSEVDALATLRQAQHLNVDSMPGKPVDLVDTEAHVQRMRQAIDQLAKDEPVNVENMPEAKFEPDAVRQADTAERIKALQNESGMIAKSEGIDTINPLRNEIPTSPDLPPAERAVETKFRDYLANNFDKAAADYRARFGNEINADHARELSADYAKSPENRAAYAGAVHEPASWFVKKLYTQELAKPADANHIDAVLFTAGGAGSGKSTALSGKINAGEFQIVYDSLMSNFNSAISRIDEAIAAGKTPVITYTIRDPVDAFIGGVLKRATDPSYGRTVRLDEFVRGHKGAAETFPKLVEHYKNNPQVIFRALDNNLGYKKADIVPLEKVGQLDYTDIQGKLNKALESEFKNGRITETIYRATQSNDAATVGRLDSKDAGGKPESKHDGQSATAATEATGQASESSLKADPLAAEAARFAADNPDLPIHLGKNADGSDITTTARQMLEDADAVVKQAHDDAKLFEIAAGCLLGAG